MSDEFYTESDFTFEEMQGYLTEVRQICVKPDLEACQALDNLFFRIQERDQSDSEVSQAEMEVDFIAKRIADLRSEARNLEVTPRDYQDWDDVLESKGKYWRPSIKKKFETRLAKLREEGKTAFAEAYAAIIPSYEKRLEALSFDLAAYVDSPEVFQQVSQRFLNRLRGDFDKPLMQRFPGEYERLRKRAEEIIQECMEKHHRKSLNEALEGNYHSTSSTTRLLRALRAADRFFDEEKKTDLQLEEQFRLAFETVAWARSKKLLSEAEFFAASGNGKRSQTLYVQAQIALSQDWPKVFGKAPVPKFPQMQIPRPLDGSDVDMSR